MEKVGLRLEFVRILGHGKARKGLAQPTSLYLNPKNGGGFLACGPENGKSGKGFAIQAGDEETFVATCLFPHLPHLNLGNRHFRRGLPK